MIGQTVRSSHSDLEHGYHSDRDTHCQAFVDVSTIVQNGRTEMLNDTCACPVMETEPVNQGTDVLEDDSQVISNPNPKTSDMFPACPEKKSGHLLNLKPKFNRDYQVTISHNFPKSKRRVDKQSPNGNHRNVEDSVKTVQNPTKPWE